MGIYLNPDNKGFKMTLAADIYVDVINLFVRLLILFGNRK